MLKGVEQNKIAKRWASLKDKYGHRRMTTIAYLLIALVRPNDEGNTTFGKYLRHMTTAILVFAWYFQSVQELGMSKMAEFLIDEVMIREDAEIH